MKIKIVSLGCRLNQSEIESVSTALQERGHDITRTGGADVFIINSCSVTGKSEGKTRRLISRAVHEAGTDGKIIIAGCMAGRLYKDGNIYYVPNDYKSLIPDLVGGWDTFNALEPRAGSRFAFEAPLRSSTNRVNLKIQDGCDNFCSYCIVPLVRGKPQSKPASQVKEEFTRLVRAGYKEIILTGVMIGKYQSGDDGLADLTEELLSTEGRFRVHLTSLTPVYLSPRLMGLFAHGKMVKHLHLSLQSGSNAVLKMMNRTYTREQYISLAESIRGKIPDFNLTTDVIVGFPGESEADFRDTIDLIKKAGFSHVHTFRYSPRPGTRAAEMKDTVPEAEKKERSREIISISAIKKREYYSRFNGRKSTFLSERSRLGITSGFNEYYAPVEVGARLPRNEFFTVVTALEPEKSRLTGTIVPGSEG
jgi:threonylcarbamoyladenosine tRNA methylthiotransferase MtaB